MLMRLPDRPWAWPALLVGRLGPAMLLLLVLLVLLVPGPALASGPPAEAVIQVAGGGGRGWSEPRNVPVVQNAATAAAAQPRHLARPRKQTQLNKIGTAHVRSPEKEPKPRRGKICMGTEDRLSAPKNPVGRYQNLRDRYTNCTYVDGNLELTWLENENMDLSFLQHIREVTGYVFISHVHVSRVVLPSLQIIRGQTLFKLADDAFALMVNNCKMNSLELPALRDILDGNVSILNNYNLCHIKTINWEEIINDTKKNKFTYKYDFAEPERDCTPCHESCDGGCWGEGPQNCQKFSKLNCSPQCHGGRCFGSEPRQCCHSFCAGGCTGPRASDCLACRNFYDDGECKLECPSMQQYSMANYRWEKNPNGKYAYGATCVKDCPKHLLKDNGACVRSCLPDKENQNGECVPCNGPCPKTCQIPQGTHIHAGNIESLKNCTVIEGSITILETTFKGFQDFDENYQLAKRHPAMDPSKLNVFSTVKKVTGFLNIQAHHPNFTTLEAFRNLEVIGGRQQTEYYSSLYIVKTSLESLNLKALREISAGRVSILENDNLCYASQIDWRKIMNSSRHNPLLDKNKDPHLCALENRGCDHQCSAKGCWGPGSSLCLSCKNFQVNGSCVESCLPQLGLFQAGDDECRKCDPQCELTCKGAGPDKCDNCKHMKDGPFCVAKCPDRKYEDKALRECMPCHKNCVGGCTGPENNTGPQGCNACNMTRINERDNVLECLSDGEPCPEGYFFEWVSPQKNKLTMLAEKAICRPCDPLCKSCTGYGAHENVCKECVGFQQDHRCVDKCSADYFPDYKSKKCVPCAQECNSCYGPLASQCHECRNYKVFPNGGDPLDPETPFNCTKTCPEEYPHKILTDDTEDPYCSADSSYIEQTLQTSPMSLTGILTSVIVSIVVVAIVVLVVVLYYTRQKARQKESVAKMTMQMQGSYDDSEPLKTTNTLPNMKNLLLVKDNEIRKGKLIAYGAFGTVHQGMWVPQGKDVKIPVALKELNSGSTANTEILEEAYMMASVEHPNLLPLLGVCMSSTSPMMLITQLMPLGALRDYVKNNKNNIGSKPMLNWCTQIAKGMAYLEEKHLVHRDLAARNVLVQSPTFVKITDFGLAKLLTTDQAEYQDNGGKHPIKWLALECIVNKKFSHKSDVWAFGVTVWELLSYGEQPYKDFHAKDIPDLLDKGQRLPQPPICTLPLYMTLIKCWQADPEGRPNFADLVREFARMAQDPGQYLAIPGDSLMRLPSYTRHDENVLIQGISSKIGGGSERVIGADEYLHPGRIPSSNTLNTPVETPLPSTPTQKFFPQNMPPPPYQESLRNSHRHSRYGSQQTFNDGFNTLNSKSRYGSNFFSASCDPLKLLEDDNVSSLPDVLPGGTLHSQVSRAGGVASSTSTMAGTTTTSGNGTGPRRQRPVTMAGLRLPTGGTGPLQVDDEDYLVPQSPMNGNNTGPLNTPTNNNAYMALIDSKGSNGTMFPYPPTQGYFLTDNPSNYGRVPDYSPFNHMPGVFSMVDNPEYIIAEQQRQPKHSHLTQSGNIGNCHTLGIPLRSHAGTNNGNSSPMGSGGPSSIQSVNQNGLPFHSLSSASSNSNSHNQPMTGLNVAINMVGSGGEESDEHDYYNDFDRLNREMQPLHPTRTTSVSSSGGSGGSNLNLHAPPGSATGTGQAPIPGLLPPPQKHETTV